jgi:hypothetical protein
MNKGFSCSWLLILLLPALGAAANLKFQCTQTDGITEYYDFNETEKSVTKSDTRKVRAVVNGDTISFEFVTEGTLQLHSIDRFTRVMTVQDLPSYSLISILHCK